MGPSNAFLQDKGVLLKTAIAAVTNILYDGGAQMSFITEPLAEELEVT